ncbi:MAG: sigma-70 family RNA polymerase sigma factor [Caldilineaceae bacterium]
MQTLSTTVIAAQKGNLQAFSRLVARFQDLAFATAFAMLGNAQLAEDVAQEAFLEAYINLAKLETPAAFPGWFRTIVVRQARRLTRRKSFTTLSIDSASDLLAPEMELPALVIQREMQANVQGAMAALPERERQVALLFYISDYSQQEIADYLNIRVSTVKSRLHTARAHLRERMIQMVQDNLQQQRPSKDARFVQEVIDVIEATEQGDLAKLNQLLERNPALAQAKDERPGATKATALHYAAWSGQQEIAALLLSYGADIDLYDETYDAPPIGWAGENGQQELFNFFLEKGAKLNIGQAAAYGELSLVQSLIEQDPALINFGTDDASGGWSPLWAAAFWQRKETVEYLLAKGADVNATTRHGETPLHGAVKGTDQAIVEHLLLKGVNMNAQANNGMTALHQAAWQRSIEIVTLLLAHGADTQLLDNNGLTPLQLALTEEGTSVEGWGAAQALVAEIAELLQHGAKRERMGANDESTKSDGDPI